MKTIDISREEIMEIDPDFFEEEDTQPMLLMTVQDQLNASTSVAGFTARARAVAPAQEMHWTDRLELELDGVDLVDVIGVHVDA